MERLREWFDNFQCVPKSMVADMAFANGDMERFYAYWGIRFLATGPRTPWPNRAEAAVRLFKRTFHLLATAKMDPTLPEPSLRQLCRMVCWARNTQLTMSGFSPLELATGRRPPDLVDLENAKPDQLTVDPLPRERLDRALRLEAQQAHLRARQMDDIRHDMARRMLPSDGPYKQGDRVYFWIQDVKGVRGPGQWMKGRVMSQEGPMVTLEATSNGRQFVAKVNQSKVKRDYDTWHDVPLPPTLE